MNPAVKVKMNSLYQNILRSQPEKVQIGEITPGCSPGNAAFQAAASNEGSVNADKMVELTGVSRQAPNKRDGREILHWRQFLNRASEYLFLFFSALAIFTSLAIVVVLFSESLPFFQEVGLSSFLLASSWAPLLEPRSYGVLPLLCGSFLVTAIAACLAVPSGLAIAIYLAEFASTSERRVLKPALEILAGIPTVVYGYFALCVITPLLQSIFPQTQVFNAASAGFAIAIMILPIIASQCDDALSAVPQSLKDAGLALGSTKLELCLGIVIPAAASGISAALVLAISRSIGETMIVALAAGASPRLSLDPLQSVQTLTAFIAQLSLGDTPAGTIEYRSIFAIGLVLFLLTLCLNLAAHNIKRGHCRYE